MIGVSQRAFQALSFVQWLSDNVVAVYEAPEPTTMAAWEVPRPSRAAPFMDCVTGAPYV
jgi:hypothetical protein